MEDILSTSVKYYSKSIKISIISETFSPEERCFSVILHADPLSSSFCPPLPANATSWSTRPPHEGPWPPLSAARTLSFLWQPTSGPPGRSGHPCLLRALWMMLGFPKLPRGEKTTRCEVFKPSCEISQTILHRMGSKAGCLLCCCTEEGQSYVLKFVICLFGGRRRPVCPAQKQNSLSTETMKAIYLFPSEFPATFVAMRLALSFYLISASSDLTWGAAEL